MRPWRVLWIMAIITDMQKGDCNKQFSLTSLAFNLSLAVDWHEVALATSNSVKLVQHGSTKARRPIFPGWVNV